MDVASLSRRGALALAAALMLLAFLVPTAGAAECTPTVSLAREGRIGSLQFPSGEYRMGVPSSSRLSCREATAAFRGFARRLDKPLPRGWTTDPSTRTFTHNGRAAFEVTAVGGAGGGSLWGSIQDFAVIWLPIIFMAAIAVVLVLTLRWMPRTKPQQIKPESSGSVHWDDVAGVEEAKQELREVVEFLRDPKRFRKLGARVPKGILVHGPPGTGKTLLAKAVANESKATFFAQSASSFVEMFAGLGAARIRRLFRAARKEAPAIVFIDELDAVGATRGNDISGEKDQTLNQLLVELDGFSASDEVVVIAASNLIDKLDPALLRPGRFDRQIFVSPPDLRGRSEILDVHTRDKPLRDVDLELVARQTSGLTGADLANICNEAAIFAGREHRDTIVSRDFESALERVIAGMQSRRVITPHEKKVVAYHEAGHALCSEMLPTVEQVHRISIVPRGRALGYTLNLPEEDRYLRTKEELMDYLVVGLGGRVAEELIFGQVTTGAADDLKKVHEISRSMVTEYGMGTELHSRKLPADDYSLSDNTRRMIDDEQQFITDQAYRRAQRIVEENKVLLEGFAYTLLEREVLEREDIERLVSTYRDDLAEAPVNGHGAGRPQVAASEPPPDQPGGLSPSK
jgi:cell division protease FtsH